MSATISNGYEVGPAISAGPISPNQTRIIWVHDPELAIQHVATIFREAVKETAAFGYGIVDGRGDLSLLFIAEQKEQT